VRTPRGQSDHRVESEARAGQASLQNLAAAQESLERAARRLERLVRREGAGEDERT
jgi:hypothetical protein